jgi:hypothetical protein
MNVRNLIGCVRAAGLCAALGVTIAIAAPKPEPVVLTEVGEQLHARYAAELATLQKELATFIPAVAEQKKAAFQVAREAVKQATAAAQAAKQPLDKIKTAQGLVAHARGKWIGDAEKGIAAAQAKLQTAVTEAERLAAQAELDKWQKNKEDGLQALAERQAALDAAKADEARHIQTHEAARTALDEALAAEMQSAMAILTDVMPLLSSEALDAKLIKGAVLAQATPRGLAEFAQQGKEQQTLVERLLADTALMKAMLEAGGPKGGRYGTAMQIYTDIQKASTRAQEGIFHRLAVGTSLEHAVPIAQRNTVAETQAPAVVDPVQRYLHYEKAYLDGELDPAFPNMTAWECRHIVNSYAPDHILAWGREMLRNYRPDHIFNPDYGWRYSGIVRTDVAYKSSRLYTDTDSLHFFQNIIRNGGICGRRAFFGRYICKSFGLPTWGVAQHAHAAVGRWTPAGWVVNFGAGWDLSWGPPEETEPGRRGTDFVLEAQARNQPEDYWKVLRAQWVGDILNEPRHDSTKVGSGGLWNALALFEKKAIVAEAKPTELAALGTELGEANESAETKAAAVAKANVTEADRQIITDPNGVITIPAAACNGAQLMNSFLGGQQMTCGGGTLDFEVNVPRAGKYALSARVVTVRDVTLQFTLNNAADAIAMPMPYTVGMWQQSEPVDISLLEGKNTFHFAKPLTSLTIKDFTLTPAQ